jgi:hypothetical protein
MLALPVLVAPHLRPPLTLQLTIESTMNPHHAAPLRLASLSVKLMVLRKQATNKQAITA